MIQEGSGDVVSLKVFEEEADQNLPQGLFRVWAGSRSQVLEWSQVLAAVIKGLFSPPATGGSTGTTQQPDVTNGGSRMFPKVWAVDQSLDLRFFPQE